MQSQLRRVTMSPVVFIVACISLGILLLLYGIYVVQANAIILQPDDLPADAVVLTSDLLAPDGLSHPLSAGPISSLRAKFSQDEQDRLLAYQTVQHFAALIPPQGVTVMNFVYEYATTADAEQAVRILHEDIQQTGTALSASPLEEATGLRGRSFLIRGAEGDSIYWFVGQRDKSLVLLIVNGMDLNPVSAVFAATLEKLKNK